MFNGSTEKNSKVRVVETCIEVPTKLSYSNRQSDFGTLLHLQMVPA